MPVRQYLDDKARPIDVQRRNLVIGNIRLGARKVSATRPGTPLDFPRFTGRHKHILEVVAAKYGGTVIPWVDHPGEFELVCTTNPINVIVDTGYTLDDRYEFYDGVTRSRVCDGNTCRYLQVIRGEKDSDRQVIDHGEVDCLCADETELICKLRTRLCVILPFCGDIGLWELDTASVVGNKELGGFVMDLKNQGVQNAYCMLGIRKVSSKGGVQIKKFNVPFLTLDPNAEETDAVFTAMLQTKLAGRKSLVASEAPQLEARKEETAAEKTPREKAGAILSSKGWLAVVYKDQMAQIREAATDKGWTMEEAVLLAEEGGSIDTLADFEHFVAGISRKTVDALFTPEEEENA